MAAHALTIAHQLLNHLDKPEIDFKHLEYGLSAPGWDTTLSFQEPEGASFFRMFRMLEKRDAVGLRAAFLAWIALLEPTHRRYGSMEDFNRARHAFVRYGKSYWRKRSEDFNAGRAPMPEEDRAPFYARHD